MPDGKEYIMKNEILRLLENDARLSDKQLAVMMNTDEATIRKEINALEESGTILAYKTIVDWEKTDLESVTAMIEVKLTPQKERGFDRVAEKIYNYPEVQAVYLMSGAYDLSVLIEGKTMKEVAYFVSHKLSTIESVISTATHFVLHKYKDKGILYDQGETDERGFF